MTNTMKKATLLILLMAIVFTGYAQDDAAIPGSGTQKSSGDLPAKTFFINPLGLLQFGPVLSTEKRIGETNGYISPHLRVGYLGVLTHLVWSADYVSPLNLGVGLSYRSMIPNDVNNNLWYLGGGLELNTGSARYDTGTSSETQNDAVGIAVLANFGYRWRTNAGRFVGVGILAGVSTSIYDEEYYVDDGSLYADYSGEAIAFGMFEITFGWEKN